MKSPLIAVSPSRRIRAAGIPIPAVIAPVLYFCLAPLPAQAQTFYNSRGAFSRATPYMTMLTFDHLIETLPYPNNRDNVYSTHDPAGITVGGVNFAGYSYGFGWETYLITPAYSAGIYSLNGTGSLMGGRGYTVIRFANAGTLVTGFGMDLTQSKTKGSVSNARITVYLQNNVSYQKALSLSPGSNPFVGFSSAGSPIAFVTITADDPSGALPPYPSAIDNFSYGGTSPVAAPKAKVSLLTLAQANAPLLTVFASIPIFVLIARRRNK